MSSNISSSITESGPLSAEKTVQKVLNGLNALTGSTGAEHSEEHLLRVRDVIYILQNLHFYPQELFVWLELRRVSRSRPPGLTEWDEIGETLLRHSRVPSYYHWIRFTGFLIYDTRPDRTQSRKRILNFIIGRSDLFTTRSRQWSNLDDIGKEVNEESLGALDTSLVSLPQIRPSGSDLDLGTQSTVPTQQTDQTLDQTAVDDGFRMDIDQSPAGTGPEIEDTVDVEM